MAKVAPGSTRTRTSSLAPKRTSGPGLEKRLRDTYTHLFEEMGDEALTAEKATLTHWFRGSDKTSELVGQRQANTFQLLSALAGYGEVPNIKTAQPKKSAEPKTAAKKTPAKGAATAKQEIDLRRGDRRYP